MAPEVLAVTIKVRSASRFRARFAFVTEDLSRQVTELSLKVAELEGELRLSEVVSRHQTELLSVKVAEIQKRYTLIIGLVIAVVLSSGGSIAAAVLQAMKSGL